MYLESKPIHLEPTEESDFYYRNVTVGFYSSNTISIHVCGYNTVYREYPNLDYEILLREHDSNLKVGTALFDFKKDELDAIVSVMQKMALKFVKDAFAKDVDYSDEVSTLMSVSHTIKNLTWKKPAWVEEEGGK